MKKFITLVVSFIVLATFGLGQEAQTQVTDLRPAAEKALLESLEKGDADKALKLTQTLMLLESLRVRRASVDASLPVIAGVGSLTNEFEPQLKNIGTAIKAFVAEYPSAREANGLEDSPVTKTTAAFIAESDELAVRAAARQLGQAWATDMAAHEKEMEELYNSFEEEAESEDSASEAKKFDTPVE